MKILRVFPRKTNWVPQDEMAFVGDPPLFRPEADEVHISTVFTWDKPEAERLCESWSQFYPVVRLGGPAYGDSGGEFMPGRYIKNGVTFTSRGCDRSCSYCLVPEREGTLSLLDIKPGWIIQDNNFLLTPREHQERVFDMLRQQENPIEFKGGIEAMLVDQWFADQLRTIKLKRVYLAADTKTKFRYTKDAVKTLNISREKLFCYVLIGANNPEETLEQAEGRLLEVWDIGCIPFAQLYQPPEYYIDYPHDWKVLQRTWARPALARRAAKSRFKQRAPKESALL